MCLIGIHTYLRIYISHVSEDAYGGRGKIVEIRDKGEKKLEKQNHKPTERVLGSSTVRMRMHQGPGVECLHLLPAPV